METFKFKKGTLVHIGGAPFALKRNIRACGIRSNYTLAQENLKMGESEKLDWKTCKHRKRDRESEFYCTLMNSMCTVGNCPKNL